MSSKSIKRKDLALNDKVQVVKELESKTSEKLVAAKFHLSQSQVLQIWNMQEKFLENLIATISIHQENMPEAVLKKMWKRCYCTGSLKLKVEGFN